MNATAPRQTPSLPGNGRMGQASSRFRTMDERVRPSLRLLPLSLCIAMALPAHAADDQQDWGLCPIEDVVPPFPDAPSAPGLPGIRIQQPTDIEGDALAATEAQESIFQGNVALNRGDQFLGTDKLTYNSETGNYVAEGSVRYQDSGMRIVAERAEGNQDADTHTIHDLRYQLTQRRGNGGAERIEMGDDGAGRPFGSTRPPRADRSPPSGRARRRPCTAPARNPARRRAGGEGCDVRRRHPDEASRRTQ